MFTLAHRVVEEIPSPVLQALSSYAWPGNIGESQNLVERSVMLSYGRGRVLQIALHDSLPRAIVTT